MGRVSHGPRGGPRASRSDCSDVVLDVRGHALPAVVHNPPSPSRRASGRARGFSRRAWRCVRRAEALGAPMRIGQVAIVAAGLALAVGAYALLAGRGAGVESSLNEGGDDVIPVVRAADLAGQSNRREREARPDAASTGTITGTV